MSEIDSSILKRIPQLENLDVTSLSVQRLGGLTNKVFRIGTDSRTYLLRVAGEGTEDYIDRMVEEFNARAAAETGVSPEVYFFDTDTGLMLAEYLDGYETMSADKFNSRPGAAERAGNVFGRLHKSGKEFRFHFELFSMIKDYLATLERLKADLPAGYHQVVKDAQPIQRSLERYPAKLAPCHCDPLAENFLDDGRRMWLVDWEYSGMNDPMWDLGDLSVEAGFSEQQDLQMLAAWNDGDITTNLHGRLVIYKAMADLLWTLWGLIQHANANPADDFWAYATNRFDRCKAQMSMDNFSRHLGAIS